jgi:hypothetical protein
MLCEFGETGRPEAQFRQYADVSRVEPLIALPHARREAAHQQRRDFE